MGGNYRQLNLKNITTPKPTDKMLHSLGTIQKWLGLIIPQKAVEDFFECSMFLDMHLDFAIEVAKIHHEISCIEQEIFSQAFEN